MSKRVVIAGLGDTGLLIAIHLSGECDLVGISPKPCLVSGQELGTRLTDPRAWERDYLMPFSRYRKLDGVRTLHGAINRIDLEAQTVHGTSADGAAFAEGYDVLVLSSGVTNGFWRNDALESFPAVRDGIARRATEIEEASSIAIVGGGATGVSVASNLAERFPGKAVHLFFSREQLLPGYHEKVRAWIERHLQDVGVHLHAGHRAALPEGFRGERFTTDPVHWSTGQPPWRPDLVLWAVGSTRPNSAFIPPSLLDADGYVKAEPTLQVPGHPNIFTVGDIAATDPHRSSARNWGAPLAAKNIRAYLHGKAGAMKTLEPPGHRWGSILGVQKTGMRVFQPNGWKLSVPPVGRAATPLSDRRSPRHLPGRSPRLSSFVPARQSLLGLEEAACLVQIAHRLYSSPAPVSSVAPWKKPPYRFIRASRSVWSIRAFSAAFWNTWDDASTKACSSRAPRRRTKTASVATCSVPSIVSRCR